MQLQLYCTNYTTPQLQLHHATTTTTAALHHITSSSCGWGDRPSDCNHCNHSKKTQLQPPFGPSVDSLCHPWFTTTNLSYRFPIFETSATALCGTTRMDTYGLYTPKWTVKLTITDHNGSMLWVHWHKPRWWSEWCPVWCTGGKNAWYRISPSHHVLILYCFDIFYRENPTKMDDLGHPLFRKQPYVFDAVLGFWFFPLKKTESYGWNYLLQMGTSHSYASLPLGKSMISYDSAMVGSGSFFWFPESHLGPSQCSVRWWYD